MHGHRKDKELAPQHPMDHTASFPLPDVGSFSYSWPTSTPKNQPEELIGDRDGGGDRDTTAFVATDPAPASRCSFDFRLSVSEQTEAMADADQMFLNGLLLPLHLASQQGHEDGHAEPVLARPLSLESSQRMIAFETSRRHRLIRPVSHNSSPLDLRCGTVTPARGAVFRTCRRRLPSFGFGSCGKQHKCISFRFLVPLYQKIVRCIWMRKAKDASHLAGSARVKLCDLGQENAIREAILHCKRSP